MSADVASLPSLYKTLYPDDAVLDLSYDGRVLWAMLEKKTDFYGSAEQVPLIYAPPGGRSASFTTAQTNQSREVQDASFLVTRAKDHQVILIDGESMEASENKEGAFVDIFEAHMDSGINNLSRTLNSDLYRSGSGSRGRILSGQGTPTITLTDARDALRFEVGMSVRVGPNDSSSGLRTGPAVITAISRRAGTLTTSGNWSTVITGAAANDYIFADGDASAKIKGLDFYIPSTDPTGGDNAFGLDRSVDVDRLAGIRSGDLSALPIEEALLQLNDEIWTYGEGTVDVNLMQSLRMTDLEKSLGARVQYVDTKFGNVGFTGIKVNHAGGVSTVYGDRDCQYTALYGLTSKVWRFHSLKMAPRPLEYKGINKNGLNIDQNSDGIVIRLGYRGNLVCRAPGFNGRATI